MSKLAGHRDFRLVWTASAISALGSRFSREALPMVAVLLLTASPSQLGVLGACTALPAVLLSPAAGAWVDRTDRRALLIGADLGRAALLLAVPVAAALGALNMGLVVCVAAGVALLSMVFDIADRAWLPSLVGRDALLEANTKLSTTDAVAETAGPALAGALVAALSAPLALVVDAASYLVSAGLLGRTGGGRRGQDLPIVLSEPPAGQDLSIVFADDPAGAWHRHPLLRTLLISTALSCFFGGFFIPLYVRFALVDLQLGPALLGLTIGAGGVGGLAGAALLGPLSRRFSPRTVLVGTRFAGALASGLIPLAQGSVAQAMALLVAAQLLGDSAMTAYSIAETTLRQQTIPDGQEGRANASFHLIEGLMVAAGSLAAGLLAEAVGLRPTLWIAVMGSLAAGLVIARSKAIRSL